MQILMYLFRADFLMLKQIQNFTYSLRKDLELFEYCYQILFIHLPTVYLQS